MTQTPRVLGEQRQQDQWLLDLEISAGLDCFDGHFPGVPIVAGVVQLDWAVAFGRQRMVIPTRFRRLLMLKFMRVIQPGDPVRLSLRSEHGELSFGYANADGEFSSGRMGFEDA